MKRMPLLLIAAAIFCQGFTIQSDETKGKGTTDLAADSTDNMMISVGRDAFRIEDQESSVKIRVGDRGLSILESLEGSRKIDFERYDSGSDHNRTSHQEDNDYEDERRGGAQYFRGHWSGLEAGVNNFNYISSMSLPADISYMTLNAGNSINFNLNISQFSLGFSRHAGIVTGIGLNWNNYRFDAGNSIAVGTDGIITEYNPDSTVPVKRSKFSTLYLNVPVLLEFQIPAGYSGHLNVAAGFIGGLKLNAWTKMVFEDGEKSKVNGDYNLNLLRGGVTARLGYQNFMVYGTYYLTPWFQDLKGPNGHNLEPFEIGVAFTFND